MSLIYKLFLSVIISVVISFGVFSTIVINIEKDKVDEIFYSKIKYNEEIYNASISTLLYTVDENVLRSMITSIYKDKEIISIELIDNSKFINIKMDTKEYENTLLVKSVINLTYNDDDLGKLIIYYSEHFMLEHLEKYKLLIFSFALLLTFLLISIVYFFINKVSSSLKLLTDASTKIAEGDLDTEVKINRKDEIGILAQKFETMRISLKKRSSINKKQSTEIKELNENLKHKVYSRTQELEDANKNQQNTINELKQTQNQLIESEKMASLGGLVAGVAHEINTPIGICLTAITHFTDSTNKLGSSYHDDSMTQSVFENYLEESAEISSILHSNISKTAELVKSFKQIAVDQTSEEKRLFHLDEYLHEITASLQSLVKKHNVNVTITCSSELQLYSYAGAFSQVMTNLIINSIKHAFIDDLRREIDITVSSNTKNIEIIYKDNGEGIKKDILEKIFDPFFTTNREGGGTGLGLNIVYNIMNTTFNGSIKCESILHKGTTFTLVIPFKNNTL